MYDLKSQKEINIYYIIIFIIYSYIVILDYTTVNTVCVFMFCYC